MFEESNKAVADCNRPVYVLYVISKLFEKWMFNFINEKLKRMPRPSHFFSRGAFSHIEFHSFSRQSLRVHPWSCKKDLFCVNKDFENLLAKMFFRKIFRKLFNMGVTGKTEKTHQKLSNQWHTTSKVNLSVSKPQSRASGVQWTSFLGPDLFLFFFSRSLDSIVHSSCYRFSDVMKFFSTDNGKLREGVHCLEKRC